MKTLRPLATRALDPLIALLARTPLTPNMLTVIGLGLNALVGLVIASGRTRLGGVLVLAASAFDLLDGALARKTGRTTQFGAFLDSSMDRVEEAALLLGAAGNSVRQGRPRGALLAFLAFVGSVMVSYTRARAEGLGLKGEAGIFDRPARIVTLAAGLILNLTGPALWLISALTGVTVVQRIRYVRRQLQP